MSTRRHWKQRWDPTAELVFTRRLKMGIPGREFVNPGDDVTPEIRAALGKHSTFRLKRWFEANFLSIKNWVPPGERKATPMQDLGAGWYLVGDRKIRGREQAELALAALA